jgi:hypothetical protein
VGLVRTSKETEGSRGTHTLGTTEGGTSQKTKRKRPSERNSLPKHHRGRDLSGHGKNVIERGALTNWRPHREGIVRSQDKNKRSRALTS